jgi:hypothetical protein
VLDVDVVVLGVDVVVLGVDVVALGVDVVALGVDVGVLGVDAVVAGGLAAFVFVDEFAGDGVFDEELPHAATAIADAITHTEARNLLLTITPSPIPCECARTVNCSASQLPWPTFVRNHIAPTGGFQRRLSVLKTGVRHPCRTLFTRFSGEAGLLYFT